MYRRLTFSLLLLAVTCVGSFPTMAAKRVALVVGNSKYIHTSELTNPKNDASDIATILREMKFNVVLGLDLDRQKFEHVIRRFARALRGAELGLFFYAGHGLQVSGINYLVPTTARLSTEDALDFEMIRLDLVQRVMERAAKTNVIFLDACRDNPLSRNLARALGTRSASIGRGLAKVEAGLGTLISFATQPGNVALDGTGRNSPFTTALKTHIRTSNEDLTSVLIRVRNDVIKSTAEQQIPWEQSALRARLYLAEKSKRHAMVNAPLANERNKKKPETKTCGGRFIELSNGRRICVELGGQSSFRDCKTCPEMVVIPAGTFQMGSPVAETLRSSTEGPQHTMTIPRPFAVSKYEVTKQQWSDCAACSSRRIDQDGHLPKSGITWDDAIAYATWLSEATNRRYRLLSESEWEYSARAGSLTPFATGPTILSSQANFNATRVYGVGAPGKFIGRSVRAGSYERNAFGLYDMHGNVAEWVADCWNSSYAAKPQALSSNGKPWLSGECFRRVVRGGSWAMAPNKLRSAYRSRASVQTRNAHIGLRVARDLD